MPVVGILLSWFGYWVAYYGGVQISGGNNGFLSLGTPGRYSVVPTDSGLNPASSSAVPTSLGTITPGAGEAKPATPATLGSLGTDPSGQTIGGFGPNVGSLPGAS